ETSLVHRVPNGIVDQVREHQAHRTAVRKNRWNIRGDIDPNVELIVAQLIRKLPEALLNEWPNGYRVERVCVGDISEARICQEIVDESSQALGFTNQNTRVLVKSLRALTSAADDGLAYHPNGCYWRAKLVRDCRDKLR